MQPIFRIYANSHYVTPRPTMQQATKGIRAELQTRLKQFNDEGKLLGLPWNRALTDDHGVPYDIVCGTFFVVGIGDEDFTSLTEQQVEKYGKKYAREMVLDVSVTPKKQKNHSNKEKNQHER